MAYDQTEIAEKAQRVALLQKGYVPVKEATPELAPVFDEKRGAEFITDVTPSVAMPVTLAASEEPSEIPAEEIGRPLSDKELDEIRQTPKAEPNLRPDAPDKGKPQSESIAQVSQVGAAKPASFAPEKSIPDAVAGAASGSAYQHVDSDFIDDVHRRAGEHNRRDFFMSQNTFEDGEDVVGSGRRAHGNFANAIAQKESQRRKEKDAEAYRRAAKDSLAAIERLYADIDRWEKENEGYRAEIAKWKQENARDQAAIDRNRQQIEENNRQLLLLEQLRQMRDSGELDPDNPEHAAMLRDAGIEPEDYKANPQLIEEREEELRAENEALSSENDALKQAIEERNAKIDENRAKIDANEERIANARAEIKSIRAEIASRPDLSPEDKSAFDAKISQLEADNASAKADNLTLSQNMDIDVEHQVSSFMKGIEKLKDIDDPVERLRRERELVSVLSPEAVEILKQDETAKTIFEEGHFDPLDKASERAAAPAATIGAPNPGG